ncbi:unnamed protein product [Dibothriocephalus latus]|uniref:Uncharacterized protein n=1 Tax=Dibothriocephalus latus TaxID=60516 RepID=A0A3P7M0E4_DIBLA|nr:unnamed protein product [Dibothriocephalus latus]
MFWRRYVDASYVIVKRNVLQNFRLMNIKTDSRLSGGTMSQSVRAYEAEASKPRGNFSFQGDQKQLVGKVVGDILDKIALIAPVIATSAPESVIAEHIVALNPSVQERGVNP